MMPDIYINLNTIVYRYTTYGRKQEAEDMMRMPAPHVSASAMEKRMLATMGDIDD